MTTIRNMILKLALMAPVFFGLSLAHAESLADLRKDLSASAVENAVDEATGSKVTLFINREDADKGTYVRWSYNPLRYVQDLFNGTINTLTLSGTTQGGYVLVFEGYAAVSGRETKVPVKGAAFFQFIQKFGRPACYTIDLSGIALQTKEPLVEGAKDGNIIVDGKPLTHCLAGPSAR